MTEKAARITFHKKNQSINSLKYEVSGTLLQKLSCNLKLLCHQIDQKIKEDKQK